MTILIALVLLSFFYFGFSSKNGNYGIKPALSPHLPPPPLPPPPLPPLPPPLPILIIKDMWPFNIISD